MGWNQRRPSVHSYFGQINPRVKSFMLDRILRCPVHLVVVVSNIAVVGIAILYTHIFAIEPKTLHWISYFLIKSLFIFISQGSLLYRAGAFIQF